MFRLFSVTRRVALVLAALSALSINAFAQVPVLMYHAHPAMNFTAEMFEGHMDYLAQAGFHTITLDELADWYENETPLPPLPIVVAFDDNYIRIYTEVFPILRERGMTCVNFAHTDYVGGTGTTEKATWGNIIEMETAGVIFTESHTKSHQYLDTMTAAQIQEELAGSKAAIETHISGKTCRYIAYPYGRYNSTVLQKAAETGYRLAFLAGGGKAYRTQPRYALTRVGVDGASLSTFISSVGPVQSPPSSGLGWVVDNNDVGFYVGAAGGWSSSTSPSGYVGLDFMSAPAGTGTKSVRWAVRLPDGMRCRIYVRWTSDSNRASNATYRITHSGGESAVAVDQRSGGGTWYSLGEYTFDDGQAAAVRLTDAADGTLSADAIWFEPVLSSVLLWNMY